MKRGPVEIVVSTVVVKLFTVSFVTSTELDHSKVSVKVPDVVSTIRVEELSELDGWLLFTL